VLTRDGIMNGELRFPDEFGRHKTLDLIGDLALVGRPFADDLRDLVDPEHRRRHERAVAMADAGQLVHLGDVARHI